MTDRTREALFTRAMQVVRPRDWGDPIAFMAMEAAVNRLIDAGMLHAPVEWRPFSEVSAAGFDDGRDVTVYRPDAGTFTAAFVPSRHEDDPPGRYSGEPQWFTAGGEDLTNDLPTIFLFVQTPPPPGGRDHG